MLHYYIKSIEVIKQLIKNASLLTTAVYKNPYLNFAVLLAVFFIVGITTTQTRYQPPKQQQPIRLFLSHCEDDLHQATLKALSGAKQSVEILMYSCNDWPVIHKLRQLCQRQVYIAIEHDHSATYEGFKRLKPPIIHHETETRGLMHKKIFCIDDQDVWIGSANWTTASLCTHDNILIALHCPELAQTLKAHKLHSYFTVGGQRLEFWDLPKQGKEGLQSLLTAIHEAKDFVRVAMFALSHPRLTQALIQAHQRGVQVEVVLDAQMARSVSASSYKLLTQAAIPVRLHTSLGTLHYKLAWIDDSLIEGSANWTQAAFTRNADCLLILHELTPQQKYKLRYFWRALRAKSTCSH